MPPMINAALASNAIERCSTAILITDGNAHDPRVTYANTAWETLTGYGRDEVLGRNPRFLQGPLTDPAEIDRLRRALADGLPFAGHTHNYRKDGRPFVMEWTIDPIRDDGGAIVNYISFQRDATDGASRDQVLETAIAEAQDTRVTQSLLMSNMSHELRTPLNAIIGYSELMLGKPFGALSPAYIDFLRQIRDSGFALLDLVDNILTLADARHRGIGLQPSRICACELVGDAMAYFADRAAARRVALRKVHDSEHIFILGDRYRLTQAVSAILSNAIKFTPTDGMITLTVGLDAARALSIRIADTGDGIDPADMERVFQPFIQADMGLDRRFDGSGIGLPLARTVMEIHGGTVAMDSTRGEGTVVTLTIPPERILSIGGQ